MSPRLVTITEGEYASLIQIRVCVENYIEARTAMQARYQGEDKADEKCRAWAASWRDLLRARTSHERLRAKRWRR